MITYNSIIPADYKSRRRPLPYEVPPSGCFFGACGRTYPAGHKLRLRTSSIKKAPPSGCFFGACGRTRTGDLLITSELLYQLSHTSMGETTKRILPHFLRFVNSQIRFCRDCLLSGAGRRAFGLPSCRTSFFAADRGYLSNIQSAAKNFADYLNGAVLPHIKRDKTTGKYRWPYPFLTLY